MRRLLVIPLLLFGLTFAGGGYFIAAETAIPMWQDWRDARDWRPVSASLQAVSGSDNSTVARYRYHYGGIDYVGERVGITRFSDNIGSWHRDTQAWLREIKRSGAPLPIWVNPRHPAEAMIDRDMRWGLFSLVSVFCSIFVLIGAAVIYGGVRGLTSPVQNNRPSLGDLRKTWQQQRDSGQTSLGFLEFSEQEVARLEQENAADGNEAGSTDWRSRKGWESASIRSDAGSGVWFFWLFALFWNGISTPLVLMLPNELQRQNYEALFALLFPLVGIFLLYLAIRRSLELYRYGRVLLHMDPYPGAIGGHVGGFLQVDALPQQTAINARELTLSLECVYSYVSGSGKNRSRRESVKWHEQGKPAIHRATRGVRLGFRFDVPENLPEADVEQTGAYHFWRVRVHADIPGIDLERSYNIPVFATGASSTSVSHDLSAQAAATRRQDSEAAKLAIASGRFEIDGLARAMRVDRQGNRLQLRFPMFRNKALTLFCAVFAGGFGFACYGIFDLISAGGLFGAFMVIFAIPFVLVALFATIATIYLPFNNLRVVIEPGSVQVLRRLLFIPIYRRHLSRSEISRLEIKRSGSTGQGTNKIEHYKVKLIDQTGKGVTVAEDIDGEDVATHLSDYLAQRIGVSAG